MTARSTIRVGVLHSLSGTMAADEKHLAEAAQMAVDEINEGGGVLGKQVEIVLRDGASKPGVFADKARELLTQEEVQTIFGCWMSSSRKAVKPIIEESNSLLWYPIQYEGLEESSNIVYTGSCLNQQIEPAVAWALSRGKRRCFLVGSDYVFPRTANNLIRALASQGGGCVIGERYVPLGSHDLAEVADAIAKARPGIVFNTINGDSNLAFFREFSRAVGDAGDCPIMSFSLAETSLRELPQESAGHYACWSYFQRLQTPENSRFLEKYRRRFGADAVVYDPIATAYTQVYLWKQAVERARSFDISEILNNVVGCSVVGPGGVMQVQTNHHVKKLALIGRATPQGRFDLVWSSEHLIEPKPWLGVEDVELPTRGLVLEALRQYPEVIHLNVELDRRVRERTTELSRANEALRAEIADHKQAEERLRESEERFRSLFENAPLGYQSLDANGDLIELNETWCELLGYTKEEVLGRNFSEFVHPDFREHFKLNFPKFKNIGYILGVEFEMVKKDGSEIIVSFDGRIGHEHDGSFKQTHCVLKDITACKQAEKEVRTLNAELEQRVKQRTDELEELHAKLLLNERTAALGAIGAGIAHELNGPMMGIVNQIQYAMGKAPRGWPAAEVLEKALANSRHCIQIVGDLLAYSRQDGGANTAEPEKGDINAAAQQALQMLHEELAAAGIDTTVQLDEHVPCVMLEESKILQVVLNLLKNARDAMKQSKQRELVLETQDRGERVALTVRDSGSGMDRDTRSRIFDTFFTTKPRGSGTGLGLGLCKSIVAWARGNIEVDSTPGVGSTFTVLIPKVKEQFLSNKDFQEVTHEE